MSKSIEKAETIFDGRYVGWLIIGIFLCAGVALAFIANGTCDEGDSVMHYQYARWAPFHSKLFFDHWAKPLYVLIASPAAQFGFHGMKLFNILVSACAIFFTLSAAQRLNIKRFSLASLFMIMSPALIVHSLSGLTEPLFALVLIISVWLYLKDKIFWSIIIISFLPFVRSEGLMMCGVFTVLLIFEKKWKMLPLILFGHFVYGVAGYPIYHNLLWTFTQIPYASMHSAYGHGEWDHFFINTLCITGVPLYILLGIGMLTGLRKLLNRNLFFENRRELLLVYGCFCTYFFGHVIFWKFGIFNSFGMLRVLVGILPLMAIIELRGFNSLINWMPSPFSRKLALIGIIIYVIIFPFSPNPYSWNYKQNFFLNTSQELLVEMRNYIQISYPDYKKCNYYYDANYTSVVMGVDFFDPKVSRRTYETWESPPSKSFLIWDDWYSVVDIGTKLETVMNDSRFELVKEFSKKDPWNTERKIFLFKTKDF